MVLHISPMGELGRRGRNFPRCLAHLKGRAQHPSSLAAGQVWPCLVFSKGLLALMPFVPSLTFQWYRFFAFLLHVYLRKILLEIDPWCNGILCKQLKICIEEGTIPLYFSSYYHPFPSSSDNFLPSIFSFFLLPFLTPPKYCCKVPERHKFIEKTWRFFFLSVWIYTRSA